MKLTVDAPAAARARAEEALRTCKINGTVLGVIEVSARQVFRVSSDPHNGCVERVLKKTLSGFREDQPYEIAPR